MGEHMFGMHQALSSVPIICTWDPRWQGEEALKELLLVKKGSIGLAGLHIRQQHEFSEVFVHMTKCVVSFFITFGQGFDCHPVYNDVLSHCRGSCSTRNSVHSTLLCAIR